MPTPSCAENLLAQAISAYRQGDRRSAESLTAQAVAANPNLADGWYLSSILALETGAFPKAIASSTRAIALNRNHGPYFDVRGEAHRRAGDLESAIADLQMAARFDPRAAETRNNLALALLAKGDLADAERQSRTALQLTSRSWNAQNTLGLILQEQRRFGDAVAAFETAINLKPDYFEAYHNLGITHGLAEHWAAAQSALTRATTLDPNNPTTWSKLGYANIRLKNYLAAKHCYQRIVDMSAARAQDLSNMALACAHLGQTEEWEAFSRRAIDMDASLPDPHMHLGIALLKQQKFADAWSEYAWRLQTETHLPHERSRGLPKWTGGRVAGGALLVWSEQGLGDEILFASLVDDLTALAKRDDFEFVWEMDARLVPLIKRARPNITFLPRHTLADQSLPPGPFAAQIPIGSLGGMFRNDVRNFPVERRSYLAADPGVTQEFRGRLTAGGCGKVVGISWHSPFSAIGDNKKTALADWARLLDTPGTRFVDLQYGKTEEERAHFRREFGDRLLHFDDVDLTRDIDTVASIITACDEVITVSNTTAHLAGALGIPTTVVMIGDAVRLWYWGDRQDRTLWYPSVRIAYADTADDIPAFLERQLIRSVI